MIFGNFFSSVATSFSEEESVKATAGALREQQQDKLDSSRAAAAEKKAANFAWQLDRKYTMSEVQSHCSLDDCWMVIFDKVYNITDFVYEHPGGDFILLEYAGRDATHPFLSSRHGSSAYKMLDRYWIGILVDEELYYSNNSSYCSVYSSLSWRSTPPKMENLSIATRQAGEEEDERDDDDEDDTDQINCITATTLSATPNQEH